MIFMKAGRMLVAAFAGTTAMTLFSYIVSDKKRKNFKEPNLLGEMIHRVTPADKENSQMSGWILHYATGLVFTLLYSLILEEKEKKQTLSSDLLIGGVSGVAATLIWKATFSLHPDPPQIHFKDYYKHLVLAHVVFGVVTLCFLKKNSSGLKENFDTSIFI